MSLEGYEDSKEFPLVGNTGEELISTEERSNELKSPGDLEIEAPLEPLEEQD